ncbi:MAG: TonB family protein [Rhodospirillales bacterium]|nr:TonB family protein [Rhodospirillales bacterium]
MARAVSTFSSRSDRLSPVAMALAVLLHALVVLTLWGLSVYRPQPLPPEEVIEVSFEPPKPPPPPEKAPQPPQPVEPGLRPPAAVTADRPTQALPAEPPSKALPAPPPPQEAARTPLPQLPLSQPPQPAPPKPAEREAPVEPAPVPAPTMQSLLAPPTPPPPAARPELKPSPLTPAPTRRPPAAQPKEEPSPHPFVNPADAFSRARVADNYLWQVARKLEGYRYQANVNAIRGVTVVRVVIARDGRLLDVSIARSSGVPEFDRGVLSGVRAGSPYAPLPPDIKGDSASFDLPLVSIAGR